MWTVIDSEDLPFTPYRTGLASIKRVIERTSVDTKRLAGFGLIEVPPGGVFGPHTHPEREEIYYVLAASGALVVQDTEIPAKAGLTLYVSGEEPHGMKNDGSRPLIVAFVTVAV